MLVLSSTKRCLSCLSQEGLHVISFIRRTSPVHQGVNFSSPVICKADNSFHTSSSCSRQRHQKKQTQGIDPRQNSRYPYVQGDPVQESIISKLSQPRNFDFGENNNKHSSGQKKIQRIKELKNVFKTDNGLLYEKITEGDVRLGRSLLEAKSKQPGSTSNTVLLEGVRLIRDSLSLGAQCEALYFSDVTVLDQLPLELLTDLKLYKILYRDMKVWSDTSTPSGLLGIFKRPPQGEPVAEVGPRMRITVILDSLKDPGNVGTLVRTAAAIGCERVLTMRGNANIWDAKVLRSSMGGHFCVPLYWGLHWSDVHNYLPENTHVLLADTRAGRTLSRAFDSQLDIEQLEQNQETDEEASDSESDDEAPTATEWKLTSKDKQMESMAYSFHKAPMSVFDYSHLPLLQEQQNGSGLPHVAIVLGGETEGLSAQAKKFAFKRFGHYVTIPMNSSVNSLNTGVAGSILMYELRRQLLLLNPDPEQN